VLLLIASGISILPAAPGEQKSPREQTPTQSSKGGYSDKTNAPSAAVKMAVTAPTYRPPLRGAPGGRVGGGARGTDRETFVLAVLAPDHTGLTISEQPSLYWFISKPATFPVELTILDPQGTEPILRTSIALPVQAGVHRLRLTDYGVRLAVGVPYRWYVAVVPDADRRSKDILAGGALERVALPEALGAKLAQADNTTAPFVYAEAGIWYDALAAISDLIEVAPNDRTLHRQRAALVEQVGLPEIGD
jgi:hypothetical protein